MFGEFFSLSFAGVWFFIINFFDKIVPLKFDIPNNLVVEKSNCTY